MLDKQMAQGQIAIAAAFTGRTRTQMGKQQESTGIFCSDVWSGIAAFIICHCHPLRFIWE
jgi:hypothetical protein